MNLDKIIDSFGWIKTLWYPLGPYFCLTSVLMCHSMHVMTGPLSIWIPKDIVCLNERWNHSQGYCVNDETVHCNEWSYGNLSSDLTMVRDFNLICDKAYVASLVNSLYVAGVFVGNIFLGSLPDRYGRKNICLFSNWALGLIALIFAFMNDITLILILRFVGGVTYSLTQFTTWMYIPELFSSKNRYVPVQYAHFGWSSGLVAVASLSYVFPNWRHLNIAVGFVCLATIPYYLVVPESLYWLVRNKKLKQSGSIISAIESRSFLIGTKGNSICNKNDFSSTDSPEKGADDDVMQRLDEVETPDDDDDVGKVEPRSLNNDDDDEDDVHSPRSNNATTALASLVDSSVAMKKGDDDDGDVGVEVIRLGEKEKKSSTFWICLHVINAFWFVDGLVYYGLQFSTQDFAGDRLLNFFLFSVVEFPAVVFAFILGHFNSRRFTLFLLHALYGAVILLSGILRFSGAFDGAEVDEDVRIAVFNGLNIAGKCFVTACFSIFVFYPAEVFPTNFRNTAFNINAAFSRASAFIATFASFAFKENTTLVEIVIGLLGLLISLTVIFLPETKNQPLPQTMEDLDALKEKTKKRLI